MSEPNFDTDEGESAETRPISVAELLAKNGNIGSPPVTGRRRRRRGNSDAVTVAELTGEIPVITDEADESPSQPQPDDGAPATDDSAPAAEDAGGTEQPAEADLPGAEAAGAAGADLPGAEPAPDHDGDGDGAREPRVDWSDPGPRFPKSPSQWPAGPEPKRSPYPRPLPRRRIERSDAEQMSPDPAANYADVEVDVMDTDVREAGLGDNFAELDAELAKLDGGTDARKNKGTPDWLDDEDDDEDIPPWQSGALRGAVVVGQSIVAVALGAGLFIAFDQLWQWNNIVALVLSVLVTLGLVAAVQVVRKTVDTTSTLIAVAVGLLITLGPLALLRSV